MAMWYRTIRPLLFLLEPERAHALGLAALRRMGRRPPAAPLSPAGGVRLFGLDFPNRVGLAAGLDKNGVAVDGLGALGFGFVEVGTVTPRAQPGQPRPRLFRVPAAGALINRMGFPNEGAAALAARLRQRRWQGIVGVNIGKNADTPLERAVDDYVACLEIVRDVSDYIVVNVSSPNTAGLRSLQASEHLEPLLTRVIDVAAGGGARRAVPLLVKISPDLSPAELDDVAALLRRLPLAGVVATNTTLGHPELRDARTLAGGLSGRPLLPLSLAVVASLRKALGPDYPIVGAGGIASGEDARRMRAAGADLVQIYSGLVYRGPALVRECVEALG